MLYLLKAVLTTTSLAALCAAQEVPAAWQGRSYFRVQGETGVAAMQLAVTGNDEFILFDRVEDNPARVNGNAAWSETIQISSGQGTPQALQTNTFCASGSFLSNGTLVVAGGDPYDGFGSRDGYQGIRLYTPGEGRTVFEDTDNIHMDRRRWYPATARLPDGSMFIMGGTDDITDYNLNPTYEFWPSKGDGSSAYSQFLVDNAPDVLFPHAFVLDEQTIFIAANKGAMILNWVTGEEQRLPNFPYDVVVTYPYGAAAVLLPLTPANNYQREILFCGGTSVPEGLQANTQTAASTQCSRMVLTPEGIATGWQLEQMPGGFERIMGNAILTPDGKVVLINGAQTGVAGYFEQPIPNLDYSSADHPIMEPVLYDPLAPAGQRFFPLGVQARVPRVYHSVASLVPDGRIITAGSNPNPHRISSGVRFPTEYRIEYLNPPYMEMDRPDYINLPGGFEYGQEFQVQVMLPAGTNPYEDLAVVIMDMSYSTHGYQYNSRMVYLEWHLAEDGQTLTIVGPPNPGVFPPGPVWLYITTKDVPSRGKKVMLGNGGNPPQYA